MVAMKIATTFLFLSPNNTTMPKQLYTLVLFSFFLSNSFSQIISIADSAHQIAGSASPYPPFYEYSYGQTIYLESEIQGSGNITALTYYYAGTSLINSDSLIIFMGKTSKQYLQTDSFPSLPILIPISLMDTVFFGKLTNYTIPGPVTITLKKPFYYSGSGNLVIAVNEKRPGLNATTFDWFHGYTGNIRNKQRTNILIDLNQMDPAIVETRPI